MNTRVPEKVLVAAGDSVLADTLVDLVSHCFHASVTSTASGRDALDVDCIESHTLALIGEGLPDWDQLDLARQLLEFRRRPIILIVNEPTADGLLAALRLGVLDVLPTPICVQQLFDAVERGLRSDQSMRREQKRLERLRCLIRRVMRERRDLNQRIDLICRDIVGAHRRLFHRILALDDEAPRFDPSRK